ncbi:DUF2797 domain-containing protein [Lentzea sp. NPDC092896]|uniref:DUF2797 domain-containing protein n=1 Tax=Lentzea sp. NPDC092896 TaxID=3364127 RepID=UPI00381335E3
MKQRLGFATGAGRWCTGRYQFADTVRVEAVACPDRAETGQSAQCGRCFRQDEFRAAHRIHQGGPISDALRRYMDQPHGLYLATFANGATKVGTAAEPRKQSRLDEQGAIVATYLTTSPNGEVVRRLEEAITARLAISQSVRAATKLKTLAALSDLSAATTSHEQAVTRAAGELAAMDVAVTFEQWTPPTEGDLLRAPGGTRMLYPHDLREGAHGFTVLSCVGTQVLVRLGESDVDYVLDLGSLKGRRVTLGSFASAAEAFQDSLF